MRPQVLNYLFSPLKNLKGIGIKKVNAYQKLLHAKEIANTIVDLKVKDLLFHLPERILERKFINNFNINENGQYVVINIQILEHNKPFNKRSPYQIICLSNNKRINIIYYAYHENYLKSKFIIGAHLIISGKLDIFNGQPQIVHPDYIVNPNQINSIPLFEPIYPLTSGLFNKNIINNLSEILVNLKDIPEWLNEDIIKSKQWISWRESLLKLHKPSQSFNLKFNRYIERLSFDELLAEQLATKVLRQKRLNDTKKIPLLLIDSQIKRVFIQKKLPFSLTQSQEQALKEIEDFTFSNKIMMKLLQGDVGSGKTIVSFLAMLNYIENRKQCALMVPTSILANQHYEYFNNLCHGENIKIELLTGKIKGKKRDQILNDLENGTIDILIGTHALIEENITFKDLAFVVIDEQHRFGVEQRLKLIQKNANVDILAMSATPIPRTLALTVYNDTDISSIREKPKNRKEILTSIISMDDYSSLIEKIKKKITEGEKIYWICPLVENNENLDLTNVENKYQEFCKIFGEEQVSFIHGKLKEKEKDAIMQDFIKSDTTKKILIATTVIEVGIDVKDATIIVIEHPERFGLSQLHQLRGRVGRGDKQSYCILLYNKNNLSSNAIKRLNIMKSTTDGFTIAEEDLKLRGSGDIVGLRQSGARNYIMADLGRDFTLLQEAAKLADYILQNNQLEQYKTLLHLFGYGDCLEYKILN